MSIKQVFSRLGRFYEKRGNDYKRRGDDYRKDEVMTIALKKLPNDYIKNEY